MTANLTLTSFYLDTARATRGQVPLWLLDTGMLCFFSGAKLKGQSRTIRYTLGICQKLAGGRGMETEGGSQLFETAEKGGVMKNGLLEGGGSCKYVSVIMWRFTHTKKKKFFL